MAHSRDTRGSRPRKSAGPRDHGRGQRASHAGKIRTLKRGAQLSATAKRGVRPWPMSKEESLTVLAEVDAELTADPQYATGWIEILVTDEGGETCERILDRRGYEWWRRR